MLNRKTIAAFDKAAPRPKSSGRQTAGRPLSALGGERKVRAPRRYGAG